MGGMSTSSGTKDTQTSQQSSWNPWAPATGQLTGTALPGLADAYSNSQAGNAATRPTDFTAGLTPGQISNFQQMLQSGGNIGGATSLMNSGMGLFDQGSTGANSALGGLLGFNPSNLNMGSLVNSANQAVSGANIPDQVRAAMQSGMENVRDVINPGIDASAAGTGNVNNSRAGIAQGIATRGLGEQAQNLSGALSGQTFSNALNTALQGGSSQNNSILSALTGAGGLGSTLLGQGAGAQSTGIQNLSQLLGLGATGGAGLQQGNQLGLTNQLQQNQYATQNPFSSISQYLPLLAGLAGLGGSGQSTGTSSEQTTATPSAMSTIGSLMGAAGGLIGSPGGALTGATGLGGIGNVGNMIGNLFGKG